MKLDIKKVNTINDISSWLKYAEPEGGESQWVEGRSAMEFASYMTSCHGQMPLEIENYLKCIGVSRKTFICYPEEVTSFAGYDLGNGSGRHHDGLLISDDFVVGIEAKVSEPFDLSIKTKMEKAKKNADNGYNMHTRLFNALKMLNPKFVDESLSSVGALMYQLISGTIGTIIESRNRKKNKAAFLIIEFVGDVKRDEKNYESKIEANQEAYDDFLDFLNLRDKNDKDRYVDVEGNVRLWIKKLQILIKKDGCKYCIL